MGAGANQATNTSACDTGEQQLVTVNRASPVEYFIRQSVSREACETAHQSTGNNTVAIRMYIVGVIAMMTGCVGVAVRLSVVRGVTRRYTSAQTQQAQASSCNCNLFHHFVISISTTNPRYALSKALRQPSSVA